MSKHFIEEDKVIPVGKFYCNCCHEDMYRSVGEEAIFDLHYFDHSWELRWDIFRMWLRSGYPKNALRAFTWPIRRNS